MDSRKRIQEIEAFMAFAFGEWPKLAAQAAGEMAKRCERCLVSDRFAKLADGICPDCNNAKAVTASPKRTEKETAALRRDLDQVLHEHEGKSATSYDALVLYSGGKDSVYLLHRLRTQYPGLRLLAVMVDNGLASSVAIENARRGASQLGVDLHFVRPPEGLFRKTFRHAFTHLDSGGCYTTVDRMDGDLTFDIGRNLAAALGIPLMLAGLSGEQVTRILDVHHFESPRERECATRTHSAGFELAKIYSAQEIERYWWNGKHWGEARVPRVLYPFYAWQIPEQEIRAEVTRLGLVPPGEDNPLVTNNDTIPVMLALDSVRLGYSGFEPEFAQMVREGKAERTPWLMIFQSLEYLARRGEFLPDCIDDTLAKIGLSREVVGLPRRGSSRDRGEAA